VTSVRQELRRPYTSLRMPASLQKHLVETAMNVLDREEFHATGLDRILDQGGLSRMTI